jgi:nitrogen fixation protein NifU and related proteins
MDLYREIILDHYKHPRNFGILVKSDKSADGYNATCGDRLHFDLLIDKNNIITDVKFSGVGCAISQAAASMLTEEIIGKNISIILKMKPKHMVKLIGTPLTPSRIKCATLPLEVLVKALVQ